jgi:hypothetical protein
MLFEEVLPRMRDGLIARRPGQFINQFFTVGDRYGSQRLVATHRVDAPWYTVQSFESTWLDDKWEIHDEDQFKVHFKEPKNNSEKPIDNE